MVSSYQATTTATRTNGPAVSTTYPVGCFIEDYVYTANSGDLDARNGRFCKTPEYPNGIYAYFVTLDANLTPAYPYTFFGSYYGVVQSGNTGPNSGHVTITEAVTTYSPSSTTSGLKENDAKLSLQLFPNPVSDYLFLFMESVASNNFTVELIDAQGKVVLTEKNIQPTISYSFDVTKLLPGNYMFKIQNDKYRSTQKVIIK